MATTIQHRLLIDDRTTSPSTTGGSNYFSFTDGWNKTSDLPNADMFSGTSTEWKGISPENQTVYVSVMNVTLHFNGTSISVHGRMTCYPASTSETVYYSQLDGTITLLTLQQTSSSEAILSNYTNLRDPSSNGEHILSLEAFTPCHTQATGAPFQVTVDYALVGLAPDTTIASNGAMMAPANDTFVVYEGDWVASEKQTHLQWGVGAMETAQVGASLSFAFFGSSITLLGSNQLTPSWTLSISIDNNTATEVTSSSPLNRVIFQSTDLPDPISPDAPHTLNLTVTKLSSQQASSFAIQAFVYNPSYSTLAQADGMFEKWREPESGGSPEPTGSPSSDAGLGGRRSPSTGAIVGGVVGGVLGLMLFGALLWWLRRRKHRQTRTTAQTGTSKNEDSAMQGVAASGTLGTAYSSPHPNSDTRDTHSSTPIPQDETTSSNPPVPYTKSYYPLGSPMSLMHNPPTFSSNNKSDTSDSTVQPSYMTRLLPVRGSELVEDSSSVLRVHPPLINPANAQPTQPNGPPVQSLVSQPPGRPSSQSRTQHHHVESSSAADDHLDAQDGVLSERETVESETARSPSTTRRLMRIIDSMRARLDALEPPPPYATDSHDQRDGNGVEDGAGHDDVDGGSGTRAL